MKAELLDVVTVYFNPMRWGTRPKLHKDFEEQMLDAGVRMTTVEAAIGERPFELPDSPHVNRVRVRVSSLLWIKENLINIGVQRLPEDWKYLAWLDGDISYRKTGWAAETVHALQIFDFVQPWEHCYDLGPNDEHIKVHNSFCRLWHRDHRCCHKMGHEGYTFAHPGYGMACRRRAWNLVGGLMDHAICGAGDHHLALSLVGKGHVSVPKGIHPNYLKAVLAWQDRADKHICGNLGFIPFNIEHRWHGRPKNRKYIERWDILTKHQYDPMTDVKRNSYGVMELAGNKPALKKDLYTYFNQRNEDQNSMD